jgi:hypothetical protein
LILIYFTTETLAAALALVAAFILLLVYFTIKVYRFYKDEERFFFYFSYVASFLLISTIGGMVYFFSQVNLYNRLEPRLWTWGSAIQGIVEKPILGWGPETFAHVFDKYSNPKHFGGESWFDRTHNLFLENLVAGGILLFLAHLSIFFSYYWILFKKEKDWFWPFFFVMPVAYFIQGLTLFDVLPIYLALYLFLAFFVHYTNDFKLTTDSYKEFSFSSYSQVLTAIFYSTIILLLIFLLYFGNYLPLRKNLLLTNVLRANDPKQVIEKAKTALEFYSPIGQQESYEAIGRHLIIFMEENIKNNVKVTPNNPALLEIMDLADRWFEKIKPNLAGIKDFYLYSIWNFNAFRLSEDPIYLTKTKNVLEEALILAPDRMELLLARIDVARVEKDQPKQEELLERVYKLRPDLVKKS